MRISDADRDRVVEELGRHLGDGRLDIEVYSLRVEEVFGAETLADLDHARRDLPFMGLRLPTAAGRPSGRGSARWAPSAASPSTAASSAASRRARLLLLVAFLAVVAVCMVEVNAQAAVLAVLLVGWVLGIALGRVSHGRR